MEFCCAFLLNSTFSDVVLIVLKVATVGIFIPKILENIINEGFLSSHPSAIELVVKYLSTYHLVWLQSWAILQ